MRFWICFPNTHLASFKVNYSLFVSTFNSLHKSPKTKKYIINEFFYLKLKAHFFNRKQIKIDNNKSQLQ